MRQSKTIEISTAHQLMTIMQHYHTVRTLQHESGRSRSWAYKVMQQLPTCEALDLNSGMRMRLVRREDVRKYMRTLRRPGNPNWG